MGEDEIKRNLIIGEFHKQSNNKALKIIKPNFNDPILYLTLVLMISIDIRYIRYIVSFVFDNKI